MPNVLFIMNWMIHVFVVVCTKIVCGLDNISDSTTYCVAGDAIVGQAARVTCFFPQDVLTGGKSVNVGHYPSFTFDKPGRDVLACRETQHGKDHCYPTEGYGYVWSTNNTLILTIDNVTKNFSGTYDCMLVQGSPSRLPCNLTVTERIVEKSAVSSTDEPSNIGLIIGVSAGVGGLFVLILLIFFCIRHFRRKRLKASRRNSLNMKNGACVSAVDTPSVSGKPAADYIDLLEKGPDDSNQVTPQCDEVQSPNANSTTPLMLSKATRSNPVKKKTKRIQNRAVSADVPKRMSQPGDKAGDLLGKQPEGGNMAMTYFREPLPGYEGEGSFEITYSFPGGNQNGMRYSATKKVAYLPDIREGRTVLMLLKVAFDRRLTFKLGSSKADGSNYKGIIWNGIPHKTSRSEGNKRYTYPDKTYLQLVQSILREKGVTGRDLTAKQQIFVDTPDQFKNYCESPFDFSSLLNNDT